MKKAILFLLVTIIGKISSNAFDFTMDFDYSDVSIDLFNSGENMYSGIRYNGLPNSGSVGQYSLPVKLVRISVPYNAVNFRLYAQAISSIEIPLQNPLQPISNDRESTNIADRYESRLPLLDVTNLTDSLAKIEFIGYAYGGHKIVTISITPIRYDAKSAKSYFFPSIQLNCSWEICDNLSNEPIKNLGGPMVAESIDQVKSMVINPNDVLANCLHEASPNSVDEDDSGIIDYLIIAPDEFCDALKELKQIRRMKGYRTEIVSINHILNSGFYHGDDKGPQLITDDAGKLKINARNVYLGDYGITKHAEGEVQLISREQQSYSLRKRVTPTEKKIAVEGRTWWYKGWQHVKGDEQEWGLKIGGEVTIENEKWNKVVLCMYTQPHQPDENISIVKDSLTLCFIKDNGRDVCFKHGDAQWLIPALKYHYIIKSEASDSIYTTYRFGQIGDSAFYGGRYSYPYSIIETEEIVNSGFVYTVYRAKFADNCGLGFITGYEGIPYIYIEGIGHPTNLFMCPLGGGYAATDRWELPELTYVTDGDDNQVIFEGAGGKKLWELAGTESIAVDESGAFSQWFNLQGLRIDKPSVPGIYFRRVGTRSEKVIVKASNR